MSYLINGSFISNDNEKTHINSKCIYIYKSNLIIISYKEPENIGFKNVFTKITIHNNKKIIINHNNDIKTNIVIESNIRNVFQYSTPYGTFTLGVFGKLIKINLSPDGGELYCNYDIDIDGLISHTNKIKIEIKNIN